MSQPVTPEVEAADIRADLALGISLRRRRRRETPYVGGNRVQVLIDGGPYFRALIDAIKEARAYVYLEAYILQADTTGRRVGEALMERARAGVECALTFDAFGSLGLDDGFLEELRTAGVKVLKFRPIAATRGRWPWTRRNHRKLCVVDGRVGLVGGMNISNDYAAPSDGGKGWRDTAVRIEGPAVPQLETMFRDVWRRYANEPLKWPSLPPEAFKPGYDVRFVENHARRTRAEIRREYLRAIVGATRTIRIMSAYFSPDPVLFRALIRAARRGVLVELITAGKTDVFYMLQVARGLYGPLMKAGVSIYEWNERVLHAKTAVVDGRWTTIGSANLNRRSGSMDYEVNATILGPEIGGELDDQFLVDRARSTRIDAQLWRQRPAIQRLLEWFWGLFRRFI